MSGLNVEQFVTDAAKSLLGKLAGNFITQFTNSSLGETLAQLGNTYETIQSLGTISADNVLNGAINSYFNSTGLNRVFGAINLNPNEYATKIRPETKIKLAGQGNISMYPDDLGPYYMSLHFKEYKRPAPFVDAQTSIVKSIYLPLPRELVESHQTKWDDASGVAADIANIIELTAAGGANEATAASAVGKVAGVGAGVKAVELARTAKGLGLLKAAVLGKIAQTLTGSTGVPGAIESSIGGSINPNLAVSFGGPTLRQFNFSWEFNPNNANESSNIKQILNDIKMYSLPALAIDGTAQFLAYPHIVEVRIHAGTDDDLILYKQSVISNVSINYAPQGIPSFFTGTREPTFLSLSLSLQELEYFLSEDFGGVSGTKGDELLTQLNALKKGVSEQLNELGVTPTTQKLLFGSLLDSGG